MINTLTERYPALDICKGEIKSACEAIIECYRRGGKLLLCGNGGSASDCEHIVGELMKGFLRCRPLSGEAKAEMKKACPELDDRLLSSLQAGLPAISLPHVSALNSAFCNDVEPEYIYAQSTLALGKKGDVLIAMSTSGNAKNVLAAARVARGLGITVIALTGRCGGLLRSAADIAICVPEDETYKIQELHLPVYHAICAAVEAEFFKE